MKRLLPILIFLAVWMLALPAWSATQDLRLTTTWQDNSDNETGFNIYLKVGTGAYSLVNTVAPGVTTYSTDILGDPGNVTYCFQETAFNSAGESPPGPEQCDTSKPIVVVTIPNSPSGTTILIEILKIDPQGVAPAKPTVRATKAAPTKTKAK